MFRNIINVFLFLPYYFNVSNHLKHLFSPWKRIVSDKRGKGFSFQELAERLSTDLVSRSIGFILRLSLLLSYLVVLGFFVLFGAPVWTLLNIVLWPLTFMVSEFRRPEQRSVDEKKRFLDRHLLEEKNRAEVEAWFEDYYTAKLKREDAFSLENLLQTPPLGRDWTSGFTPTLDDYSTDLTSPVSYKNILLDREEEVKAIEQALAKTYEANAILVGDEGVGKHTIVDGVASKFYEGRVIPPLANSRLLELNMEKVLAARTGYEEKTAFLEELLEEAARAKNIVLVISDFHKYVTNSLAGDFSSVFEKHASRPLVKILAITTPFYYEQLVFRNDKLRPLFNKVQVEEIKPLKALLILESKALVLESHYGLTIPYETLKQVIKRSQFYITYIPFPEKAITLLDEACVSAKDRGLTEVMPSLVDEVVSRKTHIPVGALNKDTKKKLLELEHILSRVIYGQDHALNEVARSVRRAFIEEGRKKPLVSLMFMGPTGVGKTETAKALAKVFFGSQERMLRFDMSFYQDRQSLADLIGSFESQTPGLLAGKIRENPYAVLLIDEIEKAPPDILNIFLTLLDEGYLVDGFGEKVDCKNLIVVATSNAGSTEIQKWVEEGRNHVELEKLTRDYVLDAGVFTPEFLNRFDKVLVYEPLTLRTALQIGYKVSERVVREYLEQKGINIQVTNDELRYLIENSFNPVSGAREIERVIRENLADRLAAKVLS